MPRINRHTICYGQSLLGLMQRNFSIGKHWCALDYLKVWTFVWKRRPVEGDLERKLTLAGRQKNVGDQSIGNLRISEMPTVSESATKSDWERTLGGVGER